VIVGNPPWAARSLARGGALSDAWLEDFRRDHAGRPLGERRSGVLSDDYVRFFRWTLEQARGARSGAVVCLATNASYLDGPVHRGMRAALVDAFERVEVLDLGGNLLLSRDATRGLAPPRRDDNVFGVRVGAALTCALRRAADEREAARVKHPTEVSFAQVEGSLADKLGALEAVSVPSVAQTPCAPWFHFRPYLGDVAAGFSLAEAFPFHREGVQTNRDVLATSDSLDALTQRLDAIESGALSLAPLPHFDPSRVRRALSEARERGDTRIERLAYRPFDERFFVTVAPLCHRSRPDLRRAIAHSERSLLAVRKDRGGAAFNLFGSARQVADACFLSTRSSCRTRVFPSHTPSGVENLSPAIAERLTRLLGRDVGSRELIAYALGTLGSPAFRLRHAAALRLDYARLPWPRDREQFEHALLVGEAFDAALHEALPLEPAGELARAWDEDRAIPVGQLVFENEGVSHEGAVLLRDVSASWWDAQVGHHRLVFAQLGSEARADSLRAALSRARHWCELEARADTLQ